MAVLKRDDFIARVKERIGDDTSDAAIALLEDMTDTYDELARGGQEDWKTKYEENDKKWRDKYMARFTGGEPAAEPGKEMLDQAEQEEQEEEGPTTYEELFSEE